MGSQRVGWGFDAHAFSADPPIVIGGVTVDDTRGVEATSDGDVLSHAIADALLGGAVLGDLGDHFPSSDPAWTGASSLEILARCVSMVAAAGWVVDHVDATVVAESVRIAPHRDAIREAVADVLGVGVENVSVKATSTDGLGFLGQDQGLAATAIVSLSLA